ncbi:AN1-type zinc finger protein 2A-like [Varroa destructor]|uniref:AN1-type domain-containing protein n=1 Tax=Varroa destructor TaxID=109461 RepID=A0A7M7K8W6_VARDE|nr:AN1-type zinc finger protein 2A-like [Varroa destructor]
MEFPHLGDHCSESSCNILDFLPIKCDACKKVFCLDHFAYTSHNCSQGHLGDVQVPVCPLCSCPVSGFRPGDPPDIAVSQHIDNMCRNSTTKVYTNRCSAHQCKKKEMIPIRCDQCRRNFCLKHRHPSDHECRPHSLKAASARSQKQEKAVQAALERQMREDEQLARALQASLNESTSHHTATSGEAANRQSTGRKKMRSPSRDGQRPLSCATAPPSSTVDQPGCTIN